MPDEPKPSGAKHWMDEIERYQLASKNWRADAKRIIDRYRLEAQPLRYLSEPAAGQAHVQHPLV